MLRPKWLSGWGKGKNLFEGSLIIDIPDIKVVEVSFNKKLVLFAVGTLPRRETVASDEASATAIGEKNGTDLEWRIFYDSTALPDFISIDKAKDFMAGAVAVSSGTASVYDAGTVYIASGNRPSKGNAPHLLDYEMAKKIEEARKKK
ncbi:MAG TPA: hypothetical protein VMT42_03775 [candidate division Zixibacteria bacterium]|nr:hypothetical protein [candidate division Zixibacteria bacterium]